MEIIRPQQPTSGSFLRLWIRWENGHHDIQLIEENSQQYHYTLIHENFYHQQFAIRYSSLENLTLKHYFVLYRGWKKDRKYIWCDYTMAVHRHWRSQTCENIESKVSVQLQDHATSLCLYWFRKDQQLFGVVYSRLSKIWTEGRLVTHHSKLSADGLQGKWPLETWDSAEK